jgi:hypothetical protein
MERKRETRACNGAEARDRHSSVHWQEESANGPGTLPVRDMQGGQTLHLRFIETFEMTHQFSSFPGQTHTVFLTAEHCVWKLVS